MSAPMPADCDTCTLSRIRIAMAVGDWKTAAHWARRLIARAPSLPYGHSDLGRVFLAEGKYGAAGKQFAIAHDKSPHFADALEGWGEALIWLNRSDLAVEKFAAAGAEAPNWGRLHLYWGEALYWSGNKAGAKTQFAEAARLALTAVERGALAQWLRKV
jgi:tetratricopeptide (TPR) repeat protein